MIGEFVKIQCGADFSGAEQSPFASTGLPQMEIGVQLQQH